MKTYSQIALILVVVGALNWGLIGLLGTNLVSSIVGSGSIIEKLVYIAIGISAVLVAYNEWGGAKK